MKTKIFFTLALILSLLACKEEKKDSINKDQNITNEEAEVVETTKKDNSFEDKVMDLRDIKLQFNDVYKFEKFGMLKQNDSAYSFVFKLDDSTLKEEVEKYSIGIIGYDSSISKPFKASFNPELKIKQENKYIILTRVIKQTRYFDSIDVYMYKRKDWKASGRISSIKIKEVLFDTK